MGMDRRWEDGGSELMMNSVDDEQGFTDQPHEISKAKRLLLIRCF